ncbi:MAG: prolyl oligopeptidase family serine peptidase [Eubacteriales bacterium]|nr:prolyl oligopeptidase family serine peptidase [Eubacteriales bacterium]
MSEKIKKAIDWMFTGPNIAGCTNLAISTSFYTDEKFWVVEEKIKDGEKVSAFITVDCKSGIKAPLFDHERLAKALSKVSGKEIDSHKLPIQITHVNEDHILLRYEKISYIFDNNRLSKNKMQINPEWTCSLDHSYALIKKNHNLYQKDFKSGKLSRITKDGKKHFGYAERYEGDGDYINDLFMGIPFPTIATFNKDGSRYLTYKLDQRHVEDLYLLQNVPKDTPSRPILHTYKFGFALDADVALQQLYIGNTQKNTLIKADIPQMAHCIFESIPGKPYLSTFTIEGDMVIAYNIETNYKKGELYLIDTETGTSKKILTETSDTFIFNDFYYAFTYADRAYDHSNNTFIYGSSEKDTLIWSSNRDGYYHLYNYSLDGTIQNQITKGDFNVTRIVRVDWEAEIIYFTACGLEKDDNHRHNYLYSVNFAGNGTKQLTRLKGNHIVNMSPNCQYFVDTVTTSSKPQTTYICDVQGKYSIEICRAGIKSLEENDLILPIEIEHIIDGEPVNAVLFLPTNITESNKIPLVEYYYGGPQMCNIPTQFDRMVTFGGYAQSFAQLGIATVIIDAPGTPGRNKAYHDQCYSNLGQVAGLDYHVKMINKICEDYSILDINRVGVTGHSGGGSGSLVCLVKYPELYKAAFATSGLHAWELYSDEWGHRYMGDYDAENYRVNNPELDVDKIKGKLYLIHGELDDNVHPLNTMRIVDKLIKADKDFQFLIIPNRHHEIQSHPYYQRKLFEFFIESL